MKKKAKLLKESYILQTQQQRKWKPCIEKPVRIVMDLYFWDKRKRDWDNYNKLLMDALEWIVFVDDVLIEDWRVRKHYDKENPRAEIEIYAL